MTKWFCQVFCFGFICAIMLVSVPSLAAETEIRMSFDERSHLNSNMVGVEALGRGIHYSVFYERLLPGRNLSLGVGASFPPSDKGSSATYGYLFAARAFAMVIPWVGVSAAKMF